MMLIPCGQTTAKVHFKGGSINDRVRQPARFTTSRYLEQNIIENSDAYKRGLIVLMSTIEVPDDAEEIARKASLSNVRVAAEGGEGVAVVENTESIEKVQVADKSDAIEWLKERYPDRGYTAVRLRSKEAFENACRECNVEFEFTAA